MNEQKIPIILNLVAALAGAGGQYFYKKGGEIIAAGGSAINWQIITGVIMFCAVMACFVAGYKLGGRISVVYPFYATTFIWGALIGIGVEKEPWNFQLLFGLALVVAGVSVMATALGKSA